MFPQQISVCFGCLEKSSYRNLCGLQGWTVGDQLQHLAVDREVFNCIWQFAVPFYFLEFFFCDVHQVFNYNPLQVKLFHTDGAWKDPRPKFLYFPCHRRKQSEFFDQFPPGIMYILWSRFSPCIFSYSNAAAPFQRCSCVLSSFQILPVRFGHLIETKCLMYAGQEQEQLVNITLTLQYKLHFHYFPPLSLSIGC